MGALRRLAVVVLVVLLGGVAATVRAESAAAYVDAITTATDWEVVNGWLNSQATTPVTSYVETHPTQANTWLKARTLMTRLPLIGATGAGTLALAAGALYVGWEIPHTVGASDWVYGRIAGVNGEAQPAAGTIRAYVWKAQVVSGSIYSGTGLAATSGTLVWVPTVRYSINSGSTWSERAGYVSSCVTRTASPCNDGTFTELRAGVYYTTTQAAIYDSFVGGGFGASATNSYTSNGDTVRDTTWGDTLAQFTNRINATEQRAYNSTTDAGRKNYTSTAAALAQPSPTYGGAEQVAVETLIETDDELATEIGTILNPTTDTQAETITLPQPRFNETATQYRARLRALGFLGTVTLAENAGAEILTEFGPNVVTEVEVGTTTYPLLDPWPEPPPTLTVPGTTTTITVRYNPETAPAPAPGDPGSSADPPPGNAPPPGGGGTITVGDCTCPAPDFTPITEADLGSKFPFGVVATVAGFLGTTVYAAPDAPVFDLVVNDGEVGGIAIPGGGHYVVDLNVMDTYMALIRTILTFAIWVGGLWWFGSRWFGFKGSGDPGAAVDDVW